VLDVINSHGISMSDVVQRIASKQVHSLHQVSAIQTASNAAALHWM
jgi:hypothetical protein